MTEPGLYGIDKLSSSVDTGGAYLILDRNEGEQIQDAHYVSGSDMSTAGTYPTNAPSAIIEYAGELSRIRIN